MFGEKGGIIENLLYIRNSSVYRQEVRSLMEIGLIEQAQNVMIVRLAGNKPSPVEIPCSNDMIIQRFYGDKYFAVTARQIRL